MTAVINTFVEEILKATRGKKLLGPCITHSYGYICSQEIKRCFLLGRKTITNLDSILKSRDITLPTKIHVVKAMVDSDHKESWAPKNWCFLTVVLEDTLESPLDCKIKPVNPEYSLEGLLLKWSSNTLATWCKQPTHWKRPWHWGRLEAKREGNGRGWGRWMVSLTEWTLVWANSRRQWTGKPDVLQSLGTWLRLSRSSMVNPERNRHNSESKSRNTLKSCSRKMSVCWPIDM